MKKIFKFYVVHKATYDSLTQLLDSQSATIDRQGKKLLELNLQIKQLERENKKLQEQNNRLNLFVDRTLGMEEVDFPNSYCDKN